MCFYESCFYRLPGKRYSSERLCCVPVPVLVLSSSGQGPRPGPHPVDPVTSAPACLLSRREEDPKAHGLVLRFARDRETWAWPRLRHGAQVVAMHREAAVHAKPLERAAAPDPAVQTAPSPGEPGVPCRLVRGCGGRAGARASLRLLFPSVSGEVDAPGRVQRGRRRWGPDSRAGTSCPSPSLSQAVGMRGGCWGPKCGGCAQPLHKAGEKCEHQDRKPLADGVRDGAPFWLNSINDSHRRRGAGPTGSWGSTLTPSSSNPPQT